ncbi:MULTISPECIES: NUDIX domain-containing protein [unclassified Myroides]|uniref:NUDIX hydrolase n=1 Tax=unclassified Myroides TaxID=2642485 RepID=UPI0015FBE38C|nr:MULTISPECIES: NUDIX domain-containing protein [unclassified Myroides]MBB1148995.1 NUDIX domain-containing protein [Myroides sp. NP-2]MDM1409065.1 NUDIX domain-containing protein [Myroides sp. DF42-4-2]
MSQYKTIYLASALITNSAGDMLTVRKRGSIYYMMAGGKIEIGETPVEALVRELKEELNLAVIPTDLHYLGTHQTQAVNEPNTLVHATVFHLTTSSTSFIPQAELEEIKWLTYTTYLDVPLAHLLKEFSVPLWLKQKNPSDD